MRKTVLIAASLIQLGVSLAFAQVPNTRLINHVDTPVAVTFSASGEARVPLDPTVGNIINITGFRKIYVRVGTTRATGVQLIIGKISGATLAQRFSRPINQQTQAFDVVGPHMTMLLTGGPAGTTDRVQLWVYLSS